jgi:hypothetical protein
MDSTVPDQPLTAPRGLPPRRKGLPWLIAAVAVVVIGLVVGGIFLVRRSAGSGTTPSPTPSPSVEPSPTPSPTPSPSPIPEPVWPLTGQTGEIANRPAVAVKVENSVDARPQGGLEYADIVYEELVEGGITRYIAVYHSQVPDLVVPIRSVRPMDGPIVGWLHPLLAFSGGQGAFLERAGALGVQLVSNDAGSPGFWRTDDRYAPHNVAGNVQTFLAQADGNHQASPPALFTYAVPGEATSVQAAGTPAGQVQVALSGSSTPNWTWDPGAGRWLRAEGAYPAVSATGQQLGANNVVCLSVGVNASVGVDPAGNPIPETIVTGEGDGLLASEGAVLPIRWSKASEADPVVFTDTAGQPLRVAPGTTWFELVPAGSGSYSAQ